MALIVEDGSIVVGANSYVSAAEIAAYAAARGIVLPDDGVDALAVEAFDYIESFGPKFAGEKVTPNQRTQWPRKGVVVDGYYLPLNEIPWQLKNAQIQAAIEASTTELFSNPSSGVKREKIDVIEVEYQDGDSQTGGIASLPRVESFLSLLFGRSGGRVRVVRG